MRRTLPAVVTIVVAAALTACSSTGGSVNTTAAKTGAAPATAASSAAPKKAGIGDTVDLNGSKPGDVLAVQLVKVVDPAPQHDQFSAPDAGHHYVAVQLRITNRGKNVYSDDPQADVNAKDAAGENADLAFGATAAGAEMPSSVDLTPGDSQLGFVAFQVPDGQKIVQVQYVLTEFGGDKVAQFTIG